MARRIVRMTGAVLSLAGVVFVVWQFAHARAWQQVSTSKQAWHLLLFAFAGAGAYALGLCALGAAWWSGQSGFIAQRPPFRTFFTVYAVTQFAKYLPGNVGHYIGRHMLLRRHGVGHAAIVMGAMTEAGFLVLAALVWAADNLSAVWPRSGLDPSFEQVLAIEIIALGAVIIGFQQRLSGGSPIWRVVPLCAPLRLVPVLPLHLFFFAAMASAVVLPAKALFAGPVLLLLPGVAATSWIAGFLVVGAPAGLGVREAVFMALLRGRMAENDILLLAAAFRTATFGGDLLFLLLGLAMRRGRAASPSAPASPGQGA